MQSYQINCEYGAEEKLHPFTPRLVSLIYSGRLEIPCEDRFLFVVDLRERNIRYIEDAVILACDQAGTVASQNISLHLSLSISMVDSVEKSLPSHSITQLYRKVSASFSSVRFGQVNDR